MSEQKIHLLRDEALRLIELTQQILSDMCKVPGLLTQDKSEQAQTLDINSATAKINMLDGEKQKLKTLDMVLAVVGTMKAGKSTTINAFVGAEVLPNRNAPMTAIPTLIRHTPGQIEPQLTLNNIEPIEKTRLAIRKKLEASKKNGDVLERLQQTDKELYELAKIFCGDFKPKKQHTGSSAIFKFLKGINDLVRLAPLVDVEFPFDAYSDVDSLPVICVEFAHLKDMPETSGTLTLLDTPGPNEAGQNRLRPMLKEQLRKASAVLAILDYTQLKSDADAQIREDISEIADISRGRLFALVNKFDQKGANSMDEAASVDFVQGMMCGKNSTPIKKENIFPVSSKQAYLANRARQSISRTENIPKPDRKNPTWVNDFFTEAFGKWDEDDVSDLKRIKKKADQLWSESLFEKPVESVIHTAHSNAAAIAVDSAARKLTSTAEALHTICAIRDASLKKKTNELQELVNSLQDDITTITECEKTASKKRSVMLEKFGHEIATELDLVKKSTAATVKKYLDEGRIKEAEIKKTADLAPAEMSLVASTILRSEILSRKLKFTPPRPTGNHFTEGSKEINFQQDRKSAEELIKNIERTIADILEKSNKAIENRLDLILTTFENDFQSNVIDSANKVVLSLQEKMNREGFTALSIQLPERASLDLKISGTRMLSDAVEAKSRTASKQKEQSGIWGGTKRLFGGLFGATWGFDESTVQVTDYKVDIEKIKRHVDASIKESFDGLANGLRVQVNQPLKAAADTFFATFRGTVEGIRGDLQQSVADKSKDHAIQQSIINHLSQLKKILPAQIVDANALSIDVKAFMATATT